MKNHWLLHARIYRSGIPHYVSNTTKSYLSRCSKRFGSSPDDLHSSIFPTFDNVLIVSSCKKESIETHLHKGSSLILAFLRKVKSFLNHFSNTFTNPPKPCTTLGHRCTAETHSQRTSTSIRSTRSSDECSKTQFRCVVYVGSLGDLNLSTEEVSLDGGMTKGVNLPTNAGGFAELFLDVTMPQCCLIYHVHVVSGSLIVHAVASVTAKPPTLSILGDA